MSQDASLQGRRIAVPESRQLDLFADMLERRGAEVLRCPLVAIHDHPDSAPIQAWLTQCIEGRFDDLILLTGEGLRRLLDVAERSSCKAEFVTALGQLRKITRGPKPDRALRDIDLRTDLKAASPTTEGVIESLSTLDLEGRHVAVQLYGEPNERLVDYLQSRGATVSTVSPYIYADDTETTAVEDLLSHLTGGRLDAIAFTSSPQVRRLFSVAQSCGLENELTRALNGLCVAAVGPIVAEALDRRGIKAILQPESSFFMKPLVSELARTLGPA